MSGAWEALTRRPDDAPSGKFVRTMRLIVTSAAGHGNFVHFLGCLDLLLSRNAFKMGTSLKVCLGDPPARSVLSPLEVDMEMTVTLLLLGPKNLFLN